MSHGYLIYPSTALLNLTNKLESIVLDVVGKRMIKEHTLHDIIDIISASTDLPLAGCKDHGRLFTKNIILFYITMRGHFLCDSFNKNFENKKHKSKAHRKDARLL